MNNVFRLIWNRTLGRLVVASEAARSRNKAAAQQGMVSQLPAFEVAGGAGVSRLLRPVALAVAIATGSLIVQPVQANIINTAGICTTGVASTVGRINPGTTSAQAQDGSGTYSLVAGCEASGNNQLGATVYGAFSQVTGAGGSAFGHNASAAKWATALGVESRATGNSAIALGFGGQATALNAIAIGSAGGNGTTPLSIANSTTASGQHSIAIGSNNVRGAQAFGVNSIALGAQTTADSDNSLAAGVKASATGQSAVAVGNTATAGTTRDIAIGSSAETGVIAGATAQADNVAIGTGAQAFGGTSIAIGEDAMATGTSTTSVNSVIAIGRQAKASEVAALALGSHASTGMGSSYAAAIGPNAKVGDNASGSIAIGSNAIVANKAIFSTAIGTSATVNATGSVAIGEEANVAINAIHGTAIGSTAKVLEGAVSGMAIGNEAVVSAKDAIAMGTIAQASGERSIAIGYDAIATGSVAMGASSRAGNGGSAFGDGAIATYNGGINDPAIVAGAALGENSNADVSGATALGTDATVTHEDSVALGQGSIADGSTLSTAAYQPLDVNGNPIAVAAPTADSEVSVGSAGAERRITNVAAGATDTDAVNVSQLKAVEQVASQGWQLTANGEATGENIAPGEAADFSAGKNIAITRTGNSIAVATAEDVEFSNVNVTNQLDVAGDTNIGGNTTINGDTTVKGDTYLGDNFKVVNNEAFYDGAITENTHIVNKEYVDGGIGDLANTPITFAGDTGTTDRKLGDELNIVTSNANLSTEVTDDKTLVIAMSDDLDVNSVTTNSLGVTNNATIGGTLNVTGQTTLTGGLDMAGNTITNVAPGVNGTDAVNVDQLTDVSNVANKGWDLTANGEATGENIAPGETADFSEGKNIAITRTDNSIEVATADDVDFSNVNVTNQLDVAGDTNIGGNTTINGDTTVKGDTFLGDNFSVVNNEAFYDGAITENTHIVNKEYVDGGIGDLANTPITFAGDAGTTDRKLGDELNIVTSNANLSTEVTDDETLVIAMSDDLDVNSVTTNSLGVTNNATIGGTLNVTGQTTLTGGLDMAGNTITNVAPGVNGTDAVNVDQLTDVSNVANKG
ncbi:ESPR-type extended signal peptide-containing protein, partial [Halomonas sp. N3-2A]|uniref:ESPR-type extended signal peptide-containing protein n=1 Tax=Halomonas sp. N3-2A TaxID=2014541 RepID=UPI000B5DCF73